MVDLPESSAAQPAPSPSGAPPGGGTPPPETPPPGQAESPKTIQQLLADKLNLANTIYDIEVGVSRAKELSRDHHFDVWGSPKLDNHTANAVFELDEIHRLEKALTEHRLLLITGEEEVGKGMIALRLASILLGRPGSRETLISDSLSTDVRVSFEKLTGGDRSYGDTVVIFCNAFATRNPDLLHFVENLDSRRLDWLRSRLHDRGMFLILTSDRARLPEGVAGSRLKGLKILHEVSGPGPDLLLRHLHRQAERSARKAGEEVSEKVSRLLDELGPRLVGELHTAPRISQFVEFYLLEMVKDGLSLDEVLARVRNREGWLLTELPKETEAWCFALALVLAQPFPCPDGVPWYSFYRLWREVSGHVRRELRLNRETRSVGELMVTQSLLDRVRAVVKRSSSLGVDSVQFQNGVDPARLWEALLGSGRALVSSLVPLLQRLAEDGDFIVREPAARALGRIGRIDPTSLVFPLIHRWSAPKDQFAHRHIALGQLFQGIYGDRDAVYRETCLHHLRRIVLSRTGEKVWPGAVALREIGRVDPHLALRELVELLGKGLEERLKKLVHGRWEWLRDPEGKLGGAEKERLDMALDLATLLLFTKDEQHVLAAVQYAVVGLCFARSPIQVLAELRKLLQERSEGKLLPILTLLFLRTDGIGDVLERNKPSVISPEAGTAIPVNDFLVAATFEEEAVESLRETLEATFQGADAFPGLVARSFRDKLGIVLKSWARDAVQLTETREVCVQLFAKLLDSKEQKGLQNLVFELLKWDTDFTAEGSKLAKLALDALVRSPAPRPALPAA